MILGNTVMARRMWGNAQAVSLKKITPNEVPKLDNGNWAKHQGIAKSASPLGTSRLRGWVYESKCEL